MKATCKATATTTGKRCQKPPAAGAKVCRKHGAAAPQSKAAAHRRLIAAAVEDEARKLLETNGVAVRLGDPFEQLERLAVEIAALKAAVVMRVNALTSITTPTVGGAAALAAEIVLYERSLDRLAKVLEVLAKLSLDERRTVAQEQTAEQFITAMQAVCADLSLTPEQRLRLPDAVESAMASIRLVAA